jgi:hypothetical protein
MGYLKYYEKENEIFSDVNDYVNGLLDINTILIISKKLLKHYKLQFLHVELSKGECSSFVFSKTWNVGLKLKFSKSRTTLGVICHEVAHAIEYEKYQISKHGKRHFRIMKGVINYSKRRGYNKYTNSKEQSIQSLPKPFELNNPKSNL